jgi:hypothetical protein
MAAIDKLNPTTAGHRAVGAEGLTEIESRKRNLAAIRQSSNSPEGRAVRPKFARPLSWQNNKALTKTVPGLYSRDPNPTERVGSGTER